MTRQTVVRRLVLLSLISSLSSSTAARSAAVDPTRIFNLHPRDELQCPSDRYEKCGENFPGNFCCLKGATCVSVNNGKSAMCCPDQKKCAVISTFTCDIQAQNATARPMSQFFSTDLTTTPQKCGDLCCPAGTECDAGENKCKLLEDDTTSISKPPESSSAKPSTSTPNPIATSSPANLAAQKTSSNAPSNTSVNKAIAGAANCTQFPIPAILVGFFPGLAVGVLATILIICCIGRTQTRAMKRDSTDLSSVQASVSDPIYHPEGASSYRTDFLRRTSGAGKGTHRASRASSRVKSLFTSSSSGTKSSRTAANTGTSPKTPRTPKTPKSMTPKTPSMRHEPSMESIRIYSPPNIGSDRPTTQHTTFEEMMRNAGFKEGQPYLGSPGRVDPRSRRVGEI